MNGSIPTLRGAKHALGHVRHRSFNQSIMEFTMKDRLISQLCEENKTIEDCIHGSIPLSKMAVKIIDTPQFQRLRNLNQLGSCRYVFQNAVHTRFEHSIGTYSLCKTLTKKLADNTQPFEMDSYLRKIPQLTQYIEENYGNKVCSFDRYIQELVNISALCHDIGHGAFSHIFDDVFVKRTPLKDHPNAVHEVRSGLILTDIIESDEELAELVPLEHIELMKLIIDPTPECTGFIFQIVSNSVNSMDVDKYDYITRDTRSIGQRSNFDYRHLITHALVINNNICYAEQYAFDISKLFSTRHEMHSRVYAHKGVIAAQLMLTEIMVGLSAVTNISECILDMDRFCKITDTYIMNFLPILQEISPEKCEDKRIKHAIDIYERLNRHDLYCAMSSFNTKDKIELDKMDIFKAEIEDGTVDPDDIVVFQSKIGYVSGNKANPLDNIFVYKTKNKHEGLKMSANRVDKKTISFLLGDVYQEYLNIVFYKKTDRTSKLEVIPKLKTTLQTYLEAEHPEIPM